MWVIFLVSCYHLWLGICVLLLPKLPQPFGQLEPFYKAGAGMSYFQIGWMLIITSTMALLALLFGKIWYIEHWGIRTTRRVILAGPQQIIIAYSAYAGVLGVINAWHDYGIDSEYTSRLIFSLAVSFLLAIAHFVGAVHWLRDEPRWSSKACDPCPFKKASYIARQVEEKMRRKQHEHPG